MNGLFLPWDVGSPAERPKGFLDDRQIAGRILAQLLLYDRVVVPTVDFFIVVPLDSLGRRGRFC
jgi:hypothetical protein